MTMVPLLAVLEPLISPQAASRSAEPSIRAPPPIVFKTSRRLTRLSNDNPWSAMSLLLPCKGFQFVSTRNIVSEPADVNLARRPAPPSWPLDPACPAGPRMALERASLRRGDLPAIRRPLRASRRAGHRPENAGWAGLARSVHHRRWPQPAVSPWPGPQYPRPERRPAQSPPPDSGRGADGHPAHAKGRADEPNADLGIERVRAERAAPDAEPGRRRGRAPAQ